MVRQLRSEGHYQFSTSVIPSDGDIREVHAGNPGPVNSGNGYCSRAYSTWASLRTGISGSASFQRARKSR
jgi:hypothetical protein